MSVNEILDRYWDSEKRDSPFSTVADVEGMEDYCEACDSQVDYSAGYPGTCKCEGGC